MSNDLDAERITATYSSTLTALDRKLCAVYAAVATELETPPAQFNSVLNRRRTNFDDADFLRTVGDARKECQAADIPFAIYDPVMNEATEVYSQLRYFKTVPCAPTPDFQAVASTDEAIELPLGYVSATDDYMAAHDALSLLQQRMNAIINRLCDFRSSSVGRAVPEACLPTPANAKERFALEVERTARRLEHDPELLFSDWDYNAGLNACELNRLSAALQKGRLIEKTTESTRTLLTFCHPDPAHDPIVWTVNCHGYDYFADCAKDKKTATATVAQPKFVRTLEYLRAWGCVAKPSQSDDDTDEEQDLPQLEQVAKLVLLHLYKKRLEILALNSICEDADPDKKMDKKTVKPRLEILRLHGLVQETNSGWAITPKGRKFAAELLENQ